MTIKIRQGKTGIRYYVHFRDENNIRRSQSCKTMEEARRLEAEKILEPGGNPTITFGVVAGRFLEIKSAKIRPQSLEQYQWALQNHILEVFGKRRIAKIRPSDVELFLARKLTDGGMGPAGARLLYTVLAQCFRRAERDGLIRGNPCAGLSRDLGLKQKRKDGDVKAFTVEQLTRCLETARQRQPHLYPMCLTMANTGIRIGEASALTWPDIDFDKARIRIARSRVRGGRVDSTKSGETRHVDVTDELAHELTAHLRRHRELDLRCGRKREPWVFQRPEGGFVWPGTFNRQLTATLRGAGLPLHFSAHSFRHTFASIHLQIGSPIVYVSKQLGHSSIAMMDTYGKWLSDSNMVAAGNFANALGNSLEGRR